MEPELNNGSLIIIRRNLFNIKKTAKDDMVIFINPLTGRPNVKRCSTAKDGMLFLTGDNLPESTDSRHFGSIPASEVRGWVWKKI